MRVAVSTLCPARWKEREDARRQRLFAPERTTCPRMAAYLRYTVSGGAPRHDDTVSFWGDSMRASFIHTADNHLGYEQYGLRERFDDFAKAFLDVVDDAIARQVDFFAIAGDLFNKRAIDAQTLMQASYALQRLKDAGIPTVGIEGNHDRSYYRDGTSWLQFLCWQGLITLLNPTVSDGGPDITPFDTRTRRGAYADFKSGALRVYGLPWYGVSTARVIESFSARLAAQREQEEREGVRYRVLLMHTGIDGIVPMMHGLPSYEQFQPLRGLVDYVGLGHVHKQYERDNWLFNPGSTETWGAEESLWDRGYYRVTVDTDVPEGEPRHVAELVINRRRPFFRFTFRVDGLPAPAQLYDRFERECRQWYAENEAERDASSLEPVVDVAMQGVLGFDADAIERTRLEDMVRELFHPLTVRIHDNTRSAEYDAFGDDSAEGLDRSTWHELEMHIFEELIGRDARYLPEAANWANVLSQMKQMALTGEAPAEIARVLRDARARLVR